MQDIFLKKHKQDSKHINYIVVWGFTAYISFRGLEVSVDNAWIVPNCPLLTNIFNAHINVEYCNSVKSINHV
ncbi:hypothetical protein AVEN_93772-1, partial [Araneus ventricosus]